MNPFVPLEEDKLKYLDPDSSWFEATFFPEPMLGFQRALLAEIRAGRALREAASWLLGCPAQDDLPSKPRVVVVSCGKEKWEHIMSALSAYPPPTKKEGA